MPPKILAIDDENDVLLVVKMALQNEGFDVLTAGNGLDGLELAREGKPDLVLLDVMMPKMDGFEVLRQLKEDDATAYIPVIMLTGLSDRQRIQQALVSGTVYYIVKPFEVDDLIAKIRTTLNE